MNRHMLALAAVLAPGLAAAQGTEVSIGYSGWTGFAPLTLASAAGIFEEHGLSVTLEKIPQASRHLALASGDIQCAATTLETFITWNANGVPVTQIFMLDRSHGADGLVTRNDITSVADLAGRTVAASAPGTAPYFLLGWILAQNDMTLDDVTVVNLEPGPAAQAFVAGQNDAAVTYEPYLSTVREAPDSGQILATTIDYPAIIDTFGCTPEFLAENPEAATALADSYYAALEMIAADEAGSYEIMGADVNQTAEQFGGSAQYLEWQDRAAAQTFFAEEYEGFATQAAEILLSMGVIRDTPDVTALVDPSFIAE